MSELVIPPGYALASLEMTHATIAHKAICTFGFKVTGTYVTGAATALLAALRSAIAPLHDNEITYSRLVVLVGNDGPLLRYDVSGTGTGTRTAQVIMSPQVTYLLRKSTAFAGRRYRGRTYIPFIAQNGVTQTGQLVAAELTLLTNCATALNGLPAGSPGAQVDQWALLHAASVHSATPSPTLGAFYAAETIVATQRRRLDRV